MEKKQLISVVKPLIAAALLFGSSGGVAWGQSSYGSDDDSSKGAGNNWQCGPASGNRNIYINSFGWTNPENNFGPGETGTVRPTSTNAAYQGLWSGVNQSNYNWTLPGSGRITVGGTTNVVQIDANTASVSDGGNVTCASGMCSTSNSASVTLHAPTARPDLPDNTGVLRVNGSGSDYNSTTHIQVTTVGNPVVKSSVPWTLEVFQFLDNPWRKYTYTLSLSGTNVCSVSCSGCWTTNSTSYKGVGYTVATSNGTTYVPAMITLLAGSHVRLTGIAAGYSVGAGGHGNTNATLNLPAAYYTLMNDKNFDAATIVSNGTINWGSGTSLGTDAVLGIQGNFVDGNTNIITNATGGTVLIGPNTTGQDHMTITSPTTTAAGSPFGFNSRANSCDTTVYTGTWIPLSGTGNLGNYGTTLLNPTEAQRAITVDANMKIAGTSAEMDNGKIQVYNKIGNIFYNNKIPKVPSGKAGNFLIMARDTLEMTASSNMSNNIEGAGNITIMGGKVKIHQHEAINLNPGSTGLYSVIAYASDGNPVRI